MIDLRRARTVHDLLPWVEQLFARSAEKIRLIEQEWRPENGTPVFTVEGRYQARGWTEWTEGFLVGSALLQFDATGDEAFLDLGRDKTVARMPTHLTHAGVHDHGFNNLSTYGTLWRLAREGRIAASEWMSETWPVGTKVGAEHWDDTLPLRLPNTPDKQVLYVSGSVPALGNWDAAGVPLNRDESGKYTATIAA